jgi:16S rRNA (cytidine1402-2'-O)-methyltransferase
VSLTFVPTPIGNLGDVTLRALEALRGCELLVAEDTRVARRLLSALEISGKRVVSYREQNAEAVTAEILDAAQTQRVAVVTDAGTPGISDPGRALIVAARAREIPVEVLPGPVAFVVAAVLSGFDLTGLTFAGFMPRAEQAREAALRAALARDGPTAWYETPQRVLASLESLAAIAPAAHIFVARELTKRFEQQILGTPGAVLAALERPVRGEFVVVLAPAGTSETPTTLEEPQGIDPAIDALLDDGMTVAEIAKALAGRGGGDRQAVYVRATARKRARGVGEP